MSKPETTLAWGDWQQLDLSAPCRSPGEADPEGAPIYVDPNNSLLHPSVAGSTVPTIGGLMGLGRIANRAS